jgi:hypothetical protein
VSFGISTAVLKVLGWKPGPWICRRRGFMGNPPGAGLPTSSTPAWTTLRVANITTAPLLLQKIFVFLKIKDQGFIILRNSKNNGDIER